MYKRYCSLTHALSSIHYVHYVFERSRLYILTVFSTLLLLIINLKRPHANAVIIPLMTFVVIVIVIVIVTVIVALVTSLNDILR